MPDGTNTRVEINPQIALPEPPVTKPLSSVEFGNIASGIEKAWGDDPEYQRIKEREALLVDALFRELVEGKITEDEAKRVIIARNSEVRVAAGIDALMELPNRESIDRRLVETLALAKRNGLSVSVAFADLDDFKGINDEEKGGGHDLGDAVLRAWGDSISSGFRRDTDFAGRYGGEEIVFVFPNSDEAWATEYLRGFAQGMSGEIKEAVTESGFSLPHTPTMTVGVVSEKLDPKDKREPEVIARELVKIADNRMYLGKRAGKNVVVDSAKEQEILTGQGVR